MNHAPRLQTTDRLNALIAQYGEEAAANASRFAAPTAANMDAYRLHLLIRAKAAYDEGFTGLGDSILGLYHQTSPEQ